MVPFSHNHLKSFFSCTSLTQVSNMFGWSILEERSLNPKKGRTLPLKINSFLFNIFVCYIVLWQFQCLRELGLQCLQFLRNVLVKAMPDLPETVLCITAASITLVTSTFAPQECSTTIKWDCATGHTWLDVLWAKPKVFVLTVIQHSCTWPY